MLVEVLGEHLLAVVIPEYLFTEQLDSIHLVWFELLVHPPDLGVLYCALVLAARVHLERVVFGRLGLQGQGWLRWLRL